MEDMHAINITITTCPMENDEAFNKWYNEKHIPFNMRFKGLYRVTRYKSLNTFINSSIEKSPHYLTTYSFKDLDTFNKWNVSRELEEASDPDLLKDLGVRLIWRVQYESVKTSQSVSSHKAIILDGIQYSLDKKEFFEKWYVEKAIPDTLKLSGAIGLTCFKFAGAIKRTAKLAIQTTEYPKIVTLFYFKEIQSDTAFERSDQHSDLREDLKSMFRKFGALSLYRAQYELMRTWQK